jgi:peptidoglycan hydrolase-like protein with peptidoglycan-binding domain
MSKKLIAFALAGIFALSMVAPAKAVTVDDLNAMIADLLKQIADLKTQISGVGTETGMVCFNTDLKKGMTSDDVKNLQIKLGVTPTSGYFGPITFAAVKTFQTSKGIITTGYVGPLTRAALNELYCVTTPPTTAATTPTTVAAPSEGYFTYKLSASPANGTSAKKGDSGVAVLAFTLKANNSDIALKTVKLNFNKRPWQYVSGVSFYEGSNLLKEVTAVSSAFEEYAVGTSYNLYLTDLNTTITKGETKTFTFKVDVPASPQSTGTVTLTLASQAIRGVDTAGLNIYTGAGDTRTFTTAAATTGALELSINSGAVSDKVESISETETTEHVVLAKFDLKAKYNDVRITQINNVTFVKHSSNTLDNIILAAELWDGDTMLGSVTPGTNGTDADFTDLNISIAKDVTKTLTVKASIAEIDASKTKEGDYTNVTLAANDTSIVAEDSLYNTVTSISGGLTGKNVYFFTVAPQLTFVSQDIKTDGDLTDSATGHIVFKVKAIGGPIYFSATTSTSILVDDTASATTTNAISSVTGYESLSDNVYKIAQNTEAVITMTVHLNNDGGIGGIMGAYVKNFKWGISASAPTANDWASTTNFVEPLKTDSIYLSG